MFSTGDLVKEAYEGLLGFVIKKTDVSVGYFDARSYGKYAEYQILLGDGSLKNYCEPELIMIEKVAKINLDNLLI